MLEEADLVIALREGRNKRLFLNPVPIEEVANRWISKYAARFSSALVDLKHNSTGGPLMAITTHIFQVYIAGDVQQVWASITDPEWTRRHLDATAVVEFTPPTDFATRATRADLAGAPRRRARGRTAQRGRVDGGTGRQGLTRVRVVHGDLAFSPLTWAYAKDRWSWVLDALKTALETGRPLPARCRCQASTTTRDRRLRLASRTGGRGEQRSHGNC